MAFPQGIDFRLTAAFVTDPTNYTAELGNASHGDYPTTTPQGNTVGWEQASAQRDRSTTTGDVRTAGINGAGFDAIALPINFRIDLPATGTYGVQAAFGDNAGATGTMTVQFQDTTTVLFTPVNAAATSGADAYYAANGTQETSTANWAANNPQAGSGADEKLLTFSTTIFRTNLNATGSAVIASLFIRSAGAAASKLKRYSDLNGLGASGPFFHDPLAA